MGNDPPNNPFPVRPNLYLLKGNSLSPTCYGQFPPSLGIPRLDEYRNYGSHDVSPPPPLACFFPENTAADSNFAQKRGLCVGLISMTWGFLPSESPSSDGNITRQKFPSWGYLLRGDGRDKKIHIKFINENPRHLLI